MSFILAIEGGDGAGKATTAAEVVRLLGDAGISTSPLAVPRYGDTVGGHVLGEFLSGRLPSPVSTEAAAVLYAHQQQRFTRRKLDATRIEDGMRRVWPVGRGQ